MKTVVCFFKTYVNTKKSIKILDLGSQDVNGTLRTVAPKTAEYIGVDFVDGKGVDIKIKKTMKYRSLMDSASFKSKITFPYGWIGHIPFAAWFMREVSPNVFVELGTHSGNSYFAFCQSVLENHLFTKCYAIDTWSGDEHSGGYAEDIYKDVCDYNNEHYSEFSSLMKMRFDDALKLFKDHSIDLLHIDGLHTYEAVKNDFDSWLPKLAPDAIVIFHDIEVRDRDFGVWKLWDEIKNTYPNHFEFSHSNGLGVVQIKKELNKDDFWMALTHESHINMKGYFSILGENLIALTNFKDEIRSLHEQLFSHKSLLELSGLNLEQKTRELEQKTRELEQKTRELEQKTRELEGIRSSLSWKFINFFVRLKFWLLK